MKRGFTLVELLIVIIIIGILATMAIPQYNKMVDKAKRAEAVQVLSTVGSASLMYYVQNGTVPASLDVANLDVEAPTGGKWTYAKGTHTAGAFLWLATNGANTNWKVRETVTLPSGAKAFEETKDGSTYTAIAL